MALINCPECNQKITNKAAFCPNCGLPLHPNSREFDIENFHERNIEKENEKLQQQNKFSGSPNKNKTGFNSIRNQKTLTFRRNPGCLSSFIISVIVTFLIVLGINYITSDKFIDSLKAKKYSQLQTKYTKVYLNVRNKPNTESKILRTLNPNSDISTYDTLVNGFTILINRFDSTKIGWVSNKYLQDSPLSKSQLAEIEKNKNKQATPKEDFQSNSNTNTENQNENLSLAHGLAVIEKGTYVKEDDRMVKRFDYLLRSLDNKYVESKTQICDMSTVARKQLRDRGINADFLEILEGMNSLNDRNDSYKEFKEYITIYVISRKELVSHSKTINEMQNALDLIGIDGLMRSAGLR